MSSTSSPSQLGSQLPSCISGLIQRSDPTAQVPRRVVNNLTKSLLPLVGPRLPLLGGERGVGGIAAATRCLSNQRSETQSFELRHTWQTAGKIQEKYEKATTP